MASIEEIAEKIRHFTEERDWDQFHTPKNLSMALAGEAGELLECFQWLTPEQSHNLSKVQRQKIAEEIADIQIYLIRLADKLNLDLLEEARLKISKNEAKYPAEKAKGSIKKYTDL